MKDKALPIHEIVTRLIGPIQPTGEHEVDTKRLVNLEEMTELVDKLLSDIETAAVAKTRYEASMKAIGKSAAEFLHEVYQSLTKHKEPI